MASFQHQQLLIGQVKNSVFHLDDTSVFHHFSFSLFPKFSNCPIRQSFVSAFIKLPKALRNIDWLTCQTLQTKQLIITFACHATKSHHSNIVLRSLLKYYRNFSCRNMRTNKPHYLVFCQPLFQKQGERLFFLHSLSAGFRMPLRSCAAFTHWNPLGQTLPSLMGMYLPPGE